MHPSDQKPIEAFNRLIVINNNRLECARFAFEHCSATILRGLFNKIAETSENCRAGLAFEIYKLGGIPSQGTLATSEFLKVWEEIHAAISRQDHFSILTSFCLTESVVLREYEQVINRGEEFLNSIQQRVFAEQYEALCSDAERVRNLRDVVFNAALKDAMRQEAAEARISVVQPAIPSLSYQ